MVVCVVEIFSYKSLDNIFVIFIWDLIGSRGCIEGLYLDYLRLREQRSRNFLPEEDQSPSRPLSGFQLSEDDFSQDIPEIIPIFVSEDDVVDSHYVPEPTNDDDDVSETFQQLQDVADQVKNRRQRTKRPSNDWMILEQPEEKTQSYDFDYNDSAAPQEGDNDDAVYYSDEARFPVETIFDRRERLDVKKPGPFYANSQNNFFLDKVRDFLNFLILVKTLNYKMPFFNQLFSLCEYI